MDLLWNHIQSWASAPFTSKMDLGQWFLFVGLLIVLVVLWTRILAHIPMED